MMALNILQVKIQIHDIPGLWEFGPTYLFTHSSLWTLQPKYMKLLALSFQNLLLHIISGIDKYYNEKSSSRGREWLNGESVFGQRRPFWTEKWIEMMDGRDSAAKILGLYWDVFVLRFPIRLISYHPFLLISQNEAKPG